MATAIGIALLVPGYVLAVPPLLRLRGVLRDRRVHELTRLLAGTAMIAAGWAALNRPSAVVINAAAAWGFATAWWWTGRHTPHPSPAQESRP